MIKLFFYLSLLWLSAGEVTLSGDLAMGFSEKPDPDPVTGLDRECTTTQLRALNQMYRELAVEAGVPEEVAFDTGRYANMANVEIDLDFIDNHCAANNAQTNSGGKGNGKAYGLDKLSNGFPGRGVVCPEPDETTGGRRDLQEEEDAEQGVPSNQDERELCGTFCQVPMWWYDPDCLASGCFRRQLRRTTRTLTVSQVKALKDSGIAKCMDINGPCFRCSSFEITLE